MSFCNVLGNLGWTRNPKFATYLNRVKNQEETDKLIEAWAGNYSPEEVTQVMQHAGVSAGIVQNINEDIQGIQSELGVE